MNNAHIIEFEHYCPRCLYFNNKENDEPCDKCLNHLARENSKRPIYWKDNLNKSNTHK